MPEYWYNIRDNIVRDDDTPEVAGTKRYNRRITAANKPYFMTYVYPNLRTKNNTYIKNSDYDAVRRFSMYGIRSIKDLVAYELKTQEMLDYIDYYYRYIPVGNNACVVNRICWIFEDAFNGYLSRKYVQPEFDYNILKSNVEYSRKNYIDVLAVYGDYQHHIEAFQKRSKSEKLDMYDVWQERSRLAAWFRKSCEEICSNEKELCDIVIDICYKAEKTKQFAWDICGSTILDNLLAKNGGVIHYPKLTDSDGDFVYCGEQFIMCEKEIGGDSDDCFE